VSDRYQRRLVVLQCIGVFMYVAAAWLVSALAGCREYGLTDCARKDLTVYAIAVGVGLVPLVLSIFLGRVTFIPLFLISILSSILLVPFGTVIGVPSIHALLKYRAESNARAHVT